MIFFINCIGVVLGLLGLNLLFATHFDFILGEVGFFVVNGGAICGLVIELWFRFCLYLVWIGSANGYFCIH